MSVHTLFFSFLFLNFDFDVDCGLWNCSTDVGSKCRPSLSAFASPNAADWINAHCLDIAYSCHRFDVWVQAKPQVGASNCLVVDI